MSALPRPTGALSAEAPWWSWDPVSGLRPSGRGAGCQGLPLGPAGALHPVYLRMLTLQAGLPTPSTTSASVSSVVHGPALIRGMF
jgi:hypothetical protein